MLKKIKSLYSDPLYRNSIAIMLNSAFGAFFGLLFWIVAARTMPAKDVGLATAAISAAALIIGLSRLGLDAGLVRYLPESKNRNRLYSTIAIVTLVLALVLAAVFMLGINIFSPALSFLREGWFLPVYYPGVGGHCLPVDPYYLVKKAEELGYHSKVITAGRAVNDYMPLHVFELLVDALNECERAVKGSKVVVLGFSYKENVGDMAFQKNCLGKMGTVSEEGRKVLFV